MELLIGDNPLLSHLFFNLVKQDSHKIKRQIIKKKRHEFHFDQDLEGNSNVHNPSLSLPKGPYLTLTGFAIPIKSAYPHPDHGHNLLEGLKARAYICATKMNQISNGKEVVYVRCRVMGTEDSIQKLMYANISWGWYVK